MERCRKCGKPFDPNELPPSLRRTLKRCKKCYRKVKKNSDTLWFISQGVTRSQYQKRQKDKELSKAWKGKISRD